MTFIDKHQRPPIYIVTIAEVPSRRMDLMRHFHDIGIDPLPYFVDGIHGPSANLRPMSPYSYDSGGNPTFMHSTVVGCVLSHIMALTVAVFEGSSEFICAEDDIHMEKTFIRDFSKFRDSIGDEFDVAQLEYDNHIMLVPHAEGLSATAVPYPFRSACIWWTRKAAQQALGRLKPIDKPYDILLIERVFPYMRHCVASPILARNKSVDQSTASTIAHHV